VKRQVYAVYDSKAETYMQPWYAVNDAVAKRTFAMAVNNGPEFKAHPEDFTLFHLGEFDDEKGDFANTNAPRSLLLAAACIEEK